MQAAGSSRVVKAVRGEEMKNKMKSTAGRCVRIVWRAHIRREEEFEAGCFQNGAAASEYGGWRCGLPSACIRAHALNSYVGMDLGEVEWGQGAQQWRGVRHSCWKEAGNESKEVQESNNTSKCWWSNVGWMGGVVSREGWGGPREGIVRGEGGGGGDSVL